MNNKYKLTLDRYATYRIKVPGEVRKLHLSVAEIQIKYIQFKPNDEVITVITCNMDQAGLYGFLRRLYALGLPLIEVVCLDYSPIDSG